MNQLPHASTPCPADHPLMVSWKAYQGTEDFKNSKHWAMVLAPLVQMGDPDADRKRLYGIAPIEERERHLMGSLWSCFMAGFAAAGGKIRS